MWKVVIPGSFGASFLLAGVCFLMRKRLDLSRSTTAAWIIFILATGIYGFLAMLLMEGFPKKLRCPSCGKKRFLEHSHCEHCKASWPAPKKDGTEIMEFDRTESLSRFC